MADEPPSSLGRGLTSRIVAAYVRQNQIGSDQIGTLISTVHQALTGLGNPQPCPKVSGHPPSRFGDLFIVITSFAWIAAGAARCSSGISQPGMD